MRIFQTLPYVSRKHKLELFEQLAKPTCNTTVDREEEVAPSGSECLKFIDWYPWKHRISVISISPGNIASAQKLYPEVNAVVGDACKFPGSDKCFDIAFPNAVIGHIRTFQKKQRVTFMAETLICLGGDITWEKLKTI